MSIAWNYLDKRSAAMAALKDYCSMKAILATTAEEIANGGRTWFALAGCASRSRRMVREIRRQAKTRSCMELRKLMCWKNGSGRRKSSWRGFSRRGMRWGRTKKTVLTMFFLSENGRTDAIEEISERFCVERSSAYKKKDRALAHLRCCCMGGEKGRTNTQK